MFVRLAPFTARAVTAAAASALLWTTVGVAGSAAGFGPVALAQQAPGGGQGDQGGQGGPNRSRMGRVLMSLGLSDAQKQQIRDIMAAARKQNQGVTDRDQRRANFRAAFAKIDTVLTPAQRDSLHKQMQAMRPHPQQ
ncbi:MAG TPA: Spy/CpxP family protein refolding chaperone [Candidatus Limnocylindria bacterium]|jgi:Spy/CpxP family protein refolding chaperone|nr:Spy/CpxP family protein refolding chaperone [Candidatus Limnocylindria bacterium]